MPVKPRSLLYNLITLAGLGLFAVSTAFGLPLMFLDIFSKHHQPYLGVLIYMILPGAGSAGLAIAGLGVLWERRQRRRRPGFPVPPLPQLDLNRPSHQAAVMTALVGGMVAVVLLSVTGYRAYHFTDSVQFCGLVCHQVMKPEYTAYQHSPHARVACAQCHIGPGAGWFVRSKMSGLYQVYAVMARNYPRPIATPVKNLRPAQETCEQCHWPQKFFGAMQKTFRHTLADERNSPWEIQMLIKIGGGDPKIVAAEGIHLHMNIKNKIEYIAADERREVIPWVRVTDPEGRMTEYASTESPLTPAQITQGPVRRMDCVDCHNRPSHVFYPPDRAVEEAFAVGRLDRDLPFLKREAIRLLVQPYASEREALSAISEGLTKFYRTQYPAVFQKRGSSVQGAAEELKRIYARNFFPEMRADWRAYPNHVGHLNSAGCFRCHDGLHRSSDGRVIPKDCNACHTVLAQGPPGEAAEAPLTAQPFRHPVDVGMDVSELKCSDCHTGASGI